MLFAYKHTGKTTLHSTQQTGLNQTQVHMHTATIIINLFDISYAYFRYIQSNVEMMEVHLRVWWFIPGVHILSKNFEATSKL